MRKFVADYWSRYGVAPDAGAATGYYAARILFDAIRRAGSTDSAAVRDVVHLSLNLHTSPVSGLILMPRGCWEDFVRISLTTPRVSGGVRVRASLEAARAAVPSR